MNMENRLYHRRHRDDEHYDSSSIRALPRYKTSGLSGDEWRVGYELTLSFKEVVVFQRVYTRLRYALAHLMWVTNVAHELTEDEGFREKAWVEFISKREAKTCTQVGCAKPATVFYRLKELYASDGDGPLLRAVDGLQYFVGFCAAHKTRGDCGREDADRNYELIAVDEIEKNA